MKLIVIAARHPTGFRRGLLVGCRHTPAGQRHTIPSTAAGMML
jgi:hypothetical protein